MTQKPVLRIAAERQIPPKFWECCGTALLAAAVEKGLLDAAAYPAAEGALLQRLCGLQSKGDGL